MKGALLEKPPQKPKKESEESAETQTREYSIPLKEIEEADSLESHEIRAEEPARDEEEITGQTVEVIDYPIAGVDHPLHEARKKVEEEFKRAETIEFTPKEKAKEAKQAIEEYEKQELKKEFKEEIEAKEERLKKKPYEEQAREIRREKAAEAKAKIEEYEKTEREKEETRKQLEIEEKMLEELKAKHPEAVEQVERVIRATETVYDAELKSEEEIDDEAIEKEQAEEKASAEKIKEKDLSQLLTEIEKEGRIEGGREAMDKLFEIIKQSNKSREALSAALDEIERVLPNMEDQNALKRRLAFEINNQFEDVPEEVALRIADRWVLNGRVGKGGMGAVYSAEHLFLRRDDVVKVLNLNGQVDEKRLKRFETEAKSMASYQETGIAKIYDAGYVSPEGAWMAIEKIDGQDLEHEIKEKGEYSVDEVIEAGLQLAESLAVMHREFAHRDLKPANIIRDNEGNLTLIDFGLAKDIQRSYYGSLEEAYKEVVSEIGSEGIANESDRLQKMYENGEISKDSDEYSDLQRFKALQEFEETHGGFTIVEKEVNLANTLEGAMMGTPYYWSPEQASAHGHEATTKTDIFSLGVILYEMTAGERPFKGNTIAEIMMQVVRKDPASLKELRKDVPEGLSDLIEDMMEKEADLRPSAQEVARRLEGVIKEMKKAEKVKKRGFFLKRILGGK